MALHSDPGVGPAQAVYGIHALQLVELDPGFSSPANPPYVATLRIVELSVEGIGLPFHR